MRNLAQFIAPAVLGAGMTLGFVGCADRDRPAMIPDNSVILQEAKNHPLHASAPRAGTVYVYDESQKKLVYSGPVARGDSIDLNATTDKVRINDKVVAQQELDNDHRFQIYFQEAGRNDRVLLKDADANRDVEIRDRSVDRDPDRTVIKEKTTIRERNTD